MATAFVDKCVVLLGVVVLFYATCYGFRIRDVLPQTHQAVCVATHGRTCPADKTATITTITTGAPMNLARKWHESTVSRTTRKSPAELTTTARLQRTLIEKTSKYRRDKNATGSARRGASSVEMDDDEEEVIVEVEDGEEVEGDTKFMEDFQEDQVDRVREGNEEKKPDETIISDQLSDDEEEEMKTEIKAHQRRVPDLHKKHDKIQESQTDDGEDDKDENREEDNVRKFISPKPLEKVRPTDKNKAKILFSKHSVEKPEQEDKKLADTKPMVDVKKPIKSAKQPIEITRESTEDARKLVENVGKLSESTKQVESFKTTTTKSKPEVVKIKSDEKPKTEVKLDASTPTLKIKEQSKHPEKANVKNITKPISEPLKAVSQTEKKKAKPKSVKSTDRFVTLSELNDAILRVSTFVPNFTNVESLECQQHGKIFLRQLRGYKFWALQMLDSSAKIPSNLLRGNVNQLGDYDQCLGVLAHVKVNEKTIRFQGKYCLAAVDLHASHPNMKLPVNLMQARGFVRGNMYDVRNFV